jgi:hypothetical protein
LPDAVFIPAEDSPGAASSAERLLATDLARGPWDPGAQHGGAPAALLVRALERLPGGEDLIVARVTYELLRPVPLGVLEVSAEVVRPGRRVQLLEASLRTADGVEVMRARALRVKRSDATSIAGAGAHQSVAAGGPEAGQSVPFFSSTDRMFATHAMEIRFVAGTFLDPGPATAWFRLRYPLVAGEDPTPLQRLAAAADFGNGISAILPWDRYVFINPDLTVYLERAPVGEWFLLEAQTRIAADGIGISESLLSDAAGPVGRAIQALLVNERVAT